MKLNHSFPHLIAEFIVIFVGVAVALAADSWRESLEEPNREFAYIGALEVDMEESLSVLNVAIVENSEFFEQTETVLALIRSPELEESETMNEIQILFYGVGRT